LAEQRPGPAEVVVVDDRRDTSVLHTDALPAARVTRSGGRGPAAARNIGWRATGTPWVVLLDDDVWLPTGWAARLEEDLGAADADPFAGAVSGRIAVPLPEHRAPTDWERNTAGLARARWITADLAVRRTALISVCGLDERFRRAYREDSDLALRLVRAGWTLHQGCRQSIHPVRPAGRWASLACQRGNADDALMRAAHGRSWRREISAPPGRLPWHSATVASCAGALAALAAGRRRAAAVCGLASAALITDFAARRILPGPRTRDEVATMLATSPAIPPLAVGWRLAGALQYVGARPWPGAPRAVLLDRDGTLVENVPYNGDPREVRPVLGARAALDRLRAAGLRIGVISNQSGIGRGLLTRAQVDAVNARVEELLGPFDDWQVCPHAPCQGCACRKPAPGLVRAAAAALRVPPRQVIVIGDIGADVDAAVAAGARGILVPDPATRAEEIAASPEVVRRLADAVDIVLGEVRSGRGYAAPPGWKTRAGAGSVARPAGVAR
jgi:HAD superfamily hydrolase (TIGR01662 family)